ncbi:polysaccharide biosynthesis tyrosine autokinase [Xylanimonas protaetiae]|uniref:polysaccharide biosynthesis tyrosine autokinase n=1 Tax=Xylanimonas protaetiae TaxID=2509457 RepID=UPI0013EB9D74|nr:polysaccharide biosynthesis tyrosine autokinase [Xylanimonas protaetiae]
MTFREFLHAIWSGRWFVLAGVVLAVVAVAVYTKQAVTEYQATATVTLESAEGTGVGNTPVAADSNPATVLSLPVIDAAATALAETPAEVAGTQIDPVLNGSDLSIAVTDASPRRAAAVANALANAYVANLPALVQSQIDSIDVQIKAMSDLVRTSNATLEADASDPTAAALRDAAQTNLSGLAQRKTQFLSLVPPGEVTVPARGAQPVGMDATTMFGIALLAGLVLGVGLALARRGLDPHVRTSEQAEESADAPVLAELSAVKEALRSAAADGMLPVASRAATPFTESIRELRTAVQAAVGGDDYVVVFTATDPRAPRSFVAANFAASVALSGRRTIVVSGDMRRPQIDELLPEPAGHQANGGGTRPTTVTNLFLHPVPDQPLDPADFLATARARSLFEALRGDADVVVIDAPPVLAAADATILGGYADGVILVATQGKAERSILASAADRLRTNGVSLAGVALVGIQANRQFRYAASFATPSSGRFLHRRARRHASAAAPPADDTTEPAALTVPVPRLARPNTAWSTPGAGATSEPTPRQDARAAGLIVVGAADGRRARARAVAPLHSRPTR